MSPSVMSWVKGQGDLNRSNRPVRIRMPGGVGGERSCLIAPIPILLLVFYHCPHAIAGRVFHSFYTGILHGICG